MFRTLKLRLGLAKLSRSEYLNLLIDIHNHLANEMLKSKTVEEAYLNEHKAEIKMFFWFVAGKKMTSEINASIKSTLETILIDNILFNDFEDEIANDDCVWDEDDFEEFMLDRETFYENFLLAQPSEMNRYFLKIHELFFSDPFQSEVNIDEKPNFDFDFSNSFMKQVEIQNIYNYVIPGYIKSLKNLNKMCP